LVCVIFRGKVICRLLAFRRVSYFNRCLVRRIFFLAVNFRRTLSLWSCCLACPLSGRLPGGRILRSRFILSPTPNADSEYHQDDRYALHAFSSTQTSFIFIGILQRAFYPSGSSARSARCATQIWVGYTILVPPFFGGTRWGF